MKKINQKNQKGIAILEVILAVGMAGIIIVSIGQSLSSMHKLTTKSEINEKASAYARQAMETIDVLKNNDFTDNLSSLSFSFDPGFNLVVPVQESFYCHDTSGNIMTSCGTQTPDSEKITVIINYDGTKRAELSTIFTNWRHP